MRQRLIGRLLLCLVLTGCANAAPNGGGETAGVPVTAYQIRAQDLPETLLLPGRVVAAEEAQVSATLPGKVGQVYVHTGDSVQKGQLLATLETGQGEEQLQQARQALQALEAQYRQMTALPSDPADKDRIAGLEREIKRQTDQLSRYATGKSLPDPAALLTSLRQLTELQTQLARLQSEQAISGGLAALRAPLLQSMQGQIAQARQAVQLAEAQVRAGRLTSPLDGVVLAANAAPGSPAAPGLPLYSVGNLPQVEFEIYVDPNQQARLAPGQATAVSVGREAAVDARLLEVSPALQPQTHSFTARTDLPNPDKRFKPGMIGEATVTLDPHKNVLVLPKAAILHDEKGAFVLRIKDGTAESARVTTGYDNGHLAEIKSGLAAGDLVVLEGADRVQAGAALNVTKTEGEPVS